MNLLWTKYGAVRLRNYSKSITKTRKYESTKQDMKIKLLGMVSCAVTHTAVTYYETMPVIGIFFVFSIFAAFALRTFRAFVIILFFFACCVTAQVAKYYGLLILYLWA